MFFDVKLIVPAGRAVLLYWTAFHCLQQFGSCSVQLDPVNHMLSGTGLLKVCVASICVCVSLPACMHAFPEAILNYVSVRSLSPLYFLYCAAPLDSVSNSPHAGTLCIPLAPQIFIPPYRSLACGQC